MPPSPAVSEVARMRFCFVGSGAATLSGSTEGGLEGQNALLCRSLASRGHDVLLVSTGQVLEEARTAGVRIIPGWGPGGGPRGLRLLTRRLPTLGRVLESTGAEVFYARGFSLFAPTVVSAARRCGGVSLLALASDSDIMEPSRLRRAFGGGRPPRGFGVAAHLYYRFAGLSRADMVLAQSTGQEARCRRLGLECRILGNAFEPPQEVPAPEDSCDAAWVGRLSLFKGVRELADLAEACPGLRISVAGDADPSVSHLVARLSVLPNVRLLGRLSRDGTMSVISGAKILLNTSPLEGFSNAFLEAWFLGRPVVSLHSNPDGLLSGDGALGACASGSEEALASSLVSLCGDEAARREIGVRSVRYVQENHLVDAVVDRLLGFVTGTGG